MIIFPPMIAGIVQALVSNSDQLHGAGIPITGCYPDLKDIYSGIQDSGMDLDDMKSRENVFQVIPAIFSGHIIFQWNIN